MSALHDAKDTRLFPTLAPAAVEEMRSHGREETLATGAALFTEGQRDYDFFVVLDGEIRITKRVGGEERLLATHGPGEFAGEISILTGSPAIATGRATIPTRVLRIPAAEFRRMAAECTPLAETALAAMVGRTTDVDAQLRQQEKLAALGKLAAGLAHELNNPAAAVRRAAEQLRLALDRSQTLALVAGAQLSDAERERILAVRRAVAAALPAALDALAQSDQEDVLADLLEARGIAEAWKLAPALVSAGVDADRLDGLGMQEAAFAASVAWLEAGLAADALLRDVENGASRISGLVQTIKGYSHMDRSEAPEWVDVHAGLESTLAIFAPRIKGGVRVVREYADDLPRVCAYGGELNQVWTNLIDNALDALDEAGTGGHLWLRTSRDGNGVRIEIADDGPGIAPDVQARIWEPFFSTKDVGQGTGLGLDIARRIVTRRHGGQIRLRSVPGETCFAVVLPDRPPSDSVVVAAAGGGGASPASPA